MELDLTVSEDEIRRACGGIPLPELGLIEQVWSTDPISDTELPVQTKNAVANLHLEDVPEGSEIAVGVGSRGIGDIVQVTKSTVEKLRDLSFQPFVFPAMGSHGGATADGQIKQLAAVGVTEKSIGCEIRSSMEVVEVGRTAERDIPVVADANAATADGIIPINRIKPHTDFDGEVESGLSKMLVIGMGKQRGAKIAHDWAIDWSLRNMIPEIAEILLAELPVLGGIAILEDQYDETARIEGIPPKGFLDRERELLNAAYDAMPTLPFEDLDVLVVDRQGKEISGQGMDTNVIGRRPFAINEPKPDHPKIKRIYLRGLTDATHGNAMGMGSADFAHRHILEKLESTSTLINAITASTVRGVRLPPIVESDRAGLLAALGTIGVTTPEDVRLLRITDTMHLQQCYASPALIDQANARDDLRVIYEPAAIQFDPQGDFQRSSLTE